MPEVDIQAIAVISDHCCHLGCNHKQLAQPANADIPPPALKNKTEFIADSEESLSGCEGEG